MGWNPGEHCSHHSTYPYCEY